VNRILSVLIQIHFLARAGQNKTKLKRQLEEQLYDYFSTDAKHVDGAPEYVKIAVKRVKEANDHVMNGPTLKVASKAQRATTEQKIAARTGKLYKHNTPIYYIVFFSR
jgi:hypothetical protein